MKWKKSNYVIMYSLVIGVILAVTLVLIIPVNQAYSILNSGDNGYTMLSGNTCLILYNLKDLENIEAEKNLLVVERGALFRQDELDYILDFVEKGGIVVASGLPNTTIQMLEYNGLKVEFYGFVYDPVFSANTSELVFVNDVVYNKTIVLDTPYHVVITNNPGVEVTRIFYTSDFSFIDQNNDKHYTVGEYIGKIPVAYEVKIGNGRLVIVLARSIMANRVYKYNIEWLTHLSEGRCIIIDQSWVKSNPILYFKSLVYSQRGISPTYASITAILAALVVVYAIKHLYSQ